MVQNCKAEVTDIHKDIEQNEPYKISISDWITFLTGESSNSINYYLSSTAILVVIFITIIELTNGVEKLNRSDILVAYFLFVFVFGFVIFFINKYYSKPYRKLLRKIMYGKIMDVEKIKEEYRKIKKKRDWETD